MPGRFIVSRRAFVIRSASLAGAPAFLTWAAAPERIEPQPYFASVKRAVEALATAGQPVAKIDADRLAELAAKEHAEAVAAAEVILDRYTLARVWLDAEGWSTTTLGGAELTLVEQGWKSFLVRVANNDGVTAKFDVSSGSSAGRMSRANAEEKAGLRDTLFKAPGSTFATRLNVNGCANSIGHPTACRARARSIMPHRRQAPRREARDHQPAASAAVWAP